jgi:hypothetical protein
MTNKNTPPIRLDEEFIPFLEKAQLNRIIIELDNKTIGNPRMSKIIVNYFKLNNDRYLELVNMEEEKC